MRLILVFFTLFLLLPASAHDSSDYRIYDESSPEHVKELYALNHANQTVAFVLEKEQEYFPLRRQKMGIWEAMDFLDQLQDESDPDLDLPQSVHCYQTAEALRKDGHPRWLILTGFIHDLGKMLACYGEPQWAIVGDIFPVGCRWSEKIVFHEYFADNPDRNVPEYQTKYGIYAPGCGLDQLHMSFGHDAYFYQVVKDYLPKEGAFIIHYHSFYPLHRDGEYDYFLNEEDHALLPWLKLFSRYDLYSKSPERLDAEKLKPYYEELVAEFFPEKIQW